MNDKIFIFVRRVAVSALSIAVLAMVTMPAMTKADYSFDNVCKCDEKIVKRDINDDDIQFRIVGGQTTRPHKYPQMCYIRYGEYTFAGIIVNRNSVLTAAHCVQGHSDVSKYEIKMGAHDVSDTTDPNVIIVCVIKIIIHPGYNNKTFSNDLAILVLSVSIAYSQSVQPACFFLKSRNSVGFVVQVVGWGSSKEGGPRSTTLQEVEVPIISNKICQKDYKNLIIDDSMSCAGYPQGGKDACEGDAGGGVFYSGTSPPTVMGITSHGYGCGRPDKYGIFSAAFYNENFIYSNTNVSSGCQIYSHDVDT